jgi:hypothetical protein
VNRFPLRRPAAVFLLVVGLLAGCAPINPEAGAVAAPGTVPPATAVTPAAPPTVAADETQAALLTDAAAIATVATRSLRVRALPTVNSDLIGGLANGETYPVTARSSDGMWMELEIPGLGRGWVAADLVLLEGNIIDLPIVAVPTIGPPTPTPTMTPTPAPLVELPTPTPGGLLGAGTALTGTATPELIGTPITGTVRVNTDVRVRVRAAPGLDAPILGHIYPGETFPALEQTFDGSWTRIAGSPDSTENPTGGWVSSPLLTFGP